MKARVVELKLQQWVKNESGNEINLKENLGYWSYPILHQCNA
jgi:hypothetical protein